MRALLLVVIAVVFVVSCGPTPAQLRMQRVQQARVDARLAGPRQAQQFAEAVHAAHNAGDYKATPQVGAADAKEALAALDRAIPRGGVDTATLVAWRALMLLDLGGANEALAELERSFSIAPNELAGSTLIEVYGQANQPDRVGPVCAATVPVLRSDDDKLSLIARCRRHMNAISPEGEMAWMSPELVAWYQNENARRMRAEIDAQNALVARQRHEQRVVRGMEQCSATCKEEGLYCQNECARGDGACDNRCVQANHACLDRCEAQAYERLDR